ncbi:MAG TPA: DUF302 domain-containing protein [Acidimicrobiia bacterium]|jgi:uncharacterized protein (DUF302 family)|nr:DUF302 domain-containing protein [Acidimicrobiia bacterium]
MKQTRYGMVITTSRSMADAEAAIRESLAGEGFGILTEIDVAATLRQKLGVERAPYKILGACNPALANRGLEAEEDLGLLLPCNVVVYVKGDETVVAALEPQLMADITDNPELQDVAAEARGRLEKALARLEA